MTTCTHLDHIQVTSLPEAVDGCEECLAAGTPWLHLRICLECGRVGCCDSSPQRHASAHAAEAGHPLMRSLEPGEDWSWCFVDEVAMRIPQIQGETRIPTVSARLVKGFALDSFDAAPALHDDLPDPEPRADQVLVRVRASSVNPVDAAIAAGRLQGAFEHEFPVVLGRDFAGVVERAGVGFDAGDEVFGFVPHADPAVHAGGWAELAVARDLIAPKPSRLGFSEAGAAAVAGMTAIAGIGVLKLFRAHTLLLIGASGGVGSFAVQLAARVGAFVIAPALPEDEEYLRGLGAGEVIDRDADVVATVRERFPNGVNALFDLVSGTREEFARHASLLKPGGKAASPLGAAGDAPGHFNVMGNADPGNARRLGQLFDTGELRVPVQRSFELARAGEALEAFSNGHVQGKIGIEVEAAS